MGKFISDRHAVFLQIEDQFSDVRTIDNLVPQGSTLGPVLFTCYASTLQKLFTTHNTSWYVDDHSFMQAFKPIDHKIHTDLRLNITKY